MPNDYDPCCEVAALTVISGSNKTLYVSKTSTYHHNDKRNDYKKFHFHLHSFCVCGFCLLLKFSTLVVTVRIIRTCKQQNI
jgi:hypothetical protein